MLQRDLFNWTTLEIFFFKCLLRIGHLYFLSFPDEMLVTAETLADFKRGFNRLSHWFVL